MMKKIITRFLLFVLLGFVVSSCHLDQKPVTAIETEAAYQTYNDAVKFNQGLIIYFRNVHYGRFDYTTELQSDYFNATVSFGNNGGALHKMDENLTSSDYDMRDNWKDLYKAIFTVNSFIANVGLITNVTDAEIASIKTFVGNAHFCRASYYHKLVRLYAKAYDPATAATDLAVPLITEYNLGEKPARATLTQVYAQIEDDIAQARTYLAAVAGSPAAVTPTIDAVKALDARVKFYMGKYAEAANIANEIIATGKYTLSTTQPQMDAEWINDNGTESIMQLFASLTEKPRSNSFAYLSWASGTNKYSPDFIPTKTTLDMYESGDLRLSTWFEKLPVLLNNINYTEIKLLAKYRGNPALEVAPNRAYAHKPKVFTISEMYLIKAESLNKTGNAAGAKDALNQLQAARGASLTDGTMANIQKEWAKEKIGEGFRIDCFKRWAVGYSGRIPQEISCIMQGPYFNGKVCPANYNFFTWAIPYDDITLNGNLVQNPGW